LQVIRQWIPVDLAVGVPLRPL